MREANDDAGQKGLNVNIRATLTTVSIDFLNRYFMLKKSFIILPKKYLSDLVYRGVA